MNKLSFFLLMLIVVMAACKKSGSDNTSVLDGKNCKILTISNTMTGSSSFGWFYYNDSGNFLYTKDLDPSGDTSIGAQYFYQGNILKYSFYNPNSNFSDTVFYFFDGAGKLVSTTEHNRTGLTLFITTTDYFYNSANQVVHTLARSTMDTAFIKVDSIVYSYSGNNVTAFTQFERSGHGTTHSVTYNMSYDNMKNFNKAMGMPADSYFYWSENNMTQMKYADSTNAF